MMITNVKHNNIQKYLQKINLLARGLDLCALHRSVFYYIKAVSDLALSNDIITIFVDDGLQSARELADLLVAQRVQESALFQELAPSHHL